MYAQWIDLTGNRSGVNRLVATEREPARNATPSKWPRDLPEHVAVTYAYAGISVRRLKMDVAP